jgi:hypothetical protein
MSDFEATTLGGSQQGFRGIDLSVLADAQDGSEILFAVARLLEEEHGKEYGYALLLRENAHAIRVITDQLQPWAVANEKDPLLKELWQDIAPRDSVMGAGDHRSQLALRLGLYS